LWGVVVVLASQGGEQFAINVVMVIMTSFGRPTGDACSHSTGNKFLKAGRTSTRWMRKSMGY